MTGPLLDGLLVVHVAFGVVAVLAGLVAIGTEKGGLTHRRAGKGYVVSMAVVVTTAFPLAVAIGSAFLFAIAIFSGYLVLSGYRVLSRKRGVPAEVSRLDWLAVGGMVVAGVGMIGWGTFHSLQGSIGVSPALAVFGTIGLALAGQQVRRFRSGTDEPRAWLTSHITFMGAAYIATVTAAATVNLVMLPPLARWLGPTVVGTPLIAIAVNRYQV